MMAQAQVARWLSPDVMVMVSGNILVTVNLVNLVLLMVLMILVIASSSYMMVVR